MRNPRLYRRGTFWWARVPTPRGTVRMSTKCTDYRAAEAVLKRLEREAAGATGRAAYAPAHTVHEAIEHFCRNGCHDISESTRRMYVEKGGHLVRLLGAVDVNMLRLDDVQGYINDRLHENAARETVRKEIVTLRRALKMAKDREILVRDPGSLIPQFRVRYEPRTRYLTHEEFIRLIQKVQPHRRLWLLLAVYTGARDSEIDRFYWEHVDFTRNTVFIAGKKTQKSRRTIPLHPALKSALELVREDGGLIVGDWQNVRHDLESACRRAGLEKVTPNDLRRTCASWMKQAGVDSYAVAQMLGHSSSRMIELVYGRLDHRTLEKAISTLPGVECTRAPGVPNESGKGGKNGHNGKRKSPDLDGNHTKSVPRDRIELSTRGFSVRQHSERKAKISMLSHYRKK